MCGCRPQGKIRTGQTCVDGPGQTDQTYKTRNMYRFYFSGTFQPVSANSSCNGCFQGHSYTNLTANDQRNVCSTCCWFDGATLTDLEFMFSSLKILVPEEPLKYSFLLKYRNQSSL